MHQLPNPELAACRDIIERQVAHMTRLVDDLLDVSRITSGKIALQKRRVVLKEAIDHAVKSTRAMIDSRAHSLSLALVHPALAVEGDFTRLSQVLQNLLHNAAKYTPEGGEIAVSVMEQAGNAIVRVRDSGVGIPAELLPRVFDLFVQGDVALDRKEGGLGIGLTLVRQIVEMHSGKIVVRSAGAGCGSEFEISLPLAAAATAGAEPPTADSPEAEDSQPSHRVLVVDDNRDAADSIALLLQLSGHQTWTAYDGQSALALAAAHGPELVLLDIGLPGMDGFETARRMRAMETLGRVKIAALTGYGQEEDIRRSRAAGFDWHMVKPVSDSDLRTLLETL